MVEEDFAVRACQSYYAYRLHEVGNTFPQSKWYNSLSSRESPGQVSESSIY